MTQKLEIGEVVKGGLDEGSKQIIINSLIRMYNNPYESIIREYTANAIDARNTAKSSKPVQISLNEAELVIEDFGLGMDDDGLKKCISLGFSTKRNDTNSTGSYGLGFKCALSVMNRFYTRVRYDGIETFISITISMPERDSLDIVVLSAKETKEENGTTIIIPFSVEREEAMFSEMNIPEFLWPTYENSSELADGIFSKFHEALTKLACFWTPGAVEIFIRGQKYLPQLSIYDAEPFANGYIAKVNKDLGLDQKYAGLYIKMGHNIYPTNKLNESIAFDNVFLFEVPNKSLKTTPNREQLIFNDHTEKVIEGIINIIRENALQEIEDARKLPTDEEKVEAYFRLKKRGIISNNSTNGPRSIVYSGGEFTPGKIIAMNDEMSLGEEVDPYSREIRRPIREKEYFISSDFFNPDERARILFADEKDVSYYSRRVKRVVHELGLRRLIILDSNIEYNELIVKRKFNELTHNEFMDLYEENLQRERDARENLPDRQQRQVYYEVWEWNEQGVLERNSYTVDEIKDMYKTIIYDKSERDNLIKPLQYMLGNINDYIVIKLSVRQKVDTLHKRFRGYDVRYIKNVVEQWAKEENNQNVLKQAIKNHIAYEKTREINTFILNYFNWAKNTNHIENELNNMKNQKLAQLLKSAFDYEKNEKIWFYSTQPYIDKKDYRDIAEEFETEWEEFGKDWLSHIYLKVSYGTRDEDVAFTQYIRYIDSIA